MRRIEGAECRGTWSNGRPVNDYWHCRQTLYLTKEGQWLLLAEVGKDSGILTLSPDQAAAWIEARKYPHVTRKKGTKTTIRRLAEVEVSKLDLPGK